MSFAATRADALDHLRRFLRDAPRYASRRNLVEPGHGNVSRLSPAIRHRLLLERETSAEALAAHRFGDVEKFLQEVHWRLYWKGWLEMRPSVWSHYRQRVASFSEAERAAARPLEQGESGVAIMDHFARELTSTGYLHNHARMWFASYWIHVRRLPWELGADFFLRHLLDADTASNTLSWRWVAGLHTPGKSYLVRRANVEYCCHPDILSQNSAGLEQLESPTPCPVPDDAFANPVPSAMPDSVGTPVGRSGLWIHDEDLSPERSHLARIPAVSAAAVCLAPESELRCRYLASAMDDAVRRSGFESPATITDDPAAVIAEWAERERLDSVVALRPFVGPLADRIDAISEKLREQGRQLVLVRRDEDREILRHATGGFFGFWKKAARELS